MNYSTWYNLISFLSSGRVDTTIWMHHITKRIKKKLDGNYTRMLSAVLNKSWKQHPTKQQLYVLLPPITLFYMDTTARSCKFYYLNASHRCWLSLYRKSLLGIAQECYESYWTLPGNNIPKSSNCTATYHSSRKLSKLDESDMRGTAGEVRTNS